MGFVHQIETKAAEEGHREIPTPLVVSVFFFCMLYFCLLKMRSTSSKKSVAMLNWVSCVCVWMLVVVGWNAWVLFSLRSLSFVVDLGFGADFFEEVESFLEIAVVAVLGLRSFDVGLDDVAQYEEQRQ